MQRVEDNPRNPILLVGFARLCRRLFELLHTAESALGFWVITASRRNPSWSIYVRGSRASLHRRRSAVTCPKFWPKTIV